MGSPKCKLFLVRTLFGIKTLQDAKVGELSFNRWQFLSVEKGTKVLEEEVERKAVGGNVVEAKDKVAVRFSKWKISSTCYFAVLNTASKKNGNSNSEKEW